MAGKKVQPRLSEQAHCRAAEVIITIPAAAFDPSGLKEVITIEGGWDPATDTVSGTLRLGERARDDFRILGRSEFHRSRKNPHFHLSVRATAAPKQFVANKKFPTVTDFFEAVAQGLKEPKHEVYVIGQHAFPSQWWTGDPLPTPLGGKHVGGMLTGVEVTYEAAGDTERIVVSTVGDEEFYAATIFNMEDVTPDLFRRSVLRSAEIASRLFREPQSEGEL